MVWFWNGKKFIIIHMGIKDVQIPDSQTQHNDLIDIVVEAAQRIEEVELEDGRMQKQLILDPEVIWWKTLIINKTTFGRFAKECKDYEALATMAFNNMSKPRALLLAREILGEVEGWKRAMDAKSSESRLDRNNTQQNLVHIVKSNKVERYYSLKEDAKKSVFEGIFGRKKQQDMDSD